MRETRLEGAVRGRRARTTVPGRYGRASPGPRGADFTTTRPNQLWVSELTYVATWRGFVYVAFVIDAFSGRIRGGGEFIECSPQ